MQDAPVINLSRVGIPQQRRPGNGADLNVKYHLSCPYCFRLWWSRNPFPEKCERCGKELSVIDKGEKYD